MLLPISLLRGKLSITDKRLMITINTFDITWTRWEALKNPAWVAFSFVSGSSTTRKHEKYHFRHPPAKIKHKQWRSWFTNAKKTHLADETSKYDEVADQCPLEKAAKTEGRHMLDWQKQANHAWARHHIRPNTQDETTAETGTTHPRWECAQGQKVDSWTSPWRTTTERGTLKLCKKEQETDECACEPSMCTIAGTSEKNPWMWRQKNDMVDIDELVGYVIVDIRWRASGIIIC